MAMLMPCPDPLTLLTELHSWQSYPGHNPASVFTYPAPKDLCSSCPLSFRYAPFVCSQSFPHSYSYLFQLNLGIASPWTLSLEPGSTMIWVAVDRSSKTFHLSPLPGLPLAAILASIFIREISIVFMVCPHTSSSIGKFNLQLASGRLWLHPLKTSRNSLGSFTCSQMGNQNVEWYLCALISAHHDDWVDHLPWA